MQWKQWNSHYLSLGDIPQTNMLSECIFRLFWKCIDYIAVVFEDSDWECVSENWWQMWFSLFGIVSDSTFPASLQNLNSTVYVFCSYVQNAQCWWKRTSWQKVFSTGQKYWKHLSFLKIILIFLSSLLIFSLKTDKRKKGYICFLYVSDNLKSLDTWIESTNVIELLLVLDVLHTTLES